ncbi:Cif family virulence factor [Rhodococcus erythropolis]|uniref:hypothetical protein n=1 Tax=Rhodococcus erythropolis TaxID=1833 RepID=UPI002227A68F|nr:hypothetical protein [Rhodococcus erythropolis]MCW2295446.1 hypothetical protein [Rhodococcus erythropolis]
MANSIERYFDLIDIARTDEMLDELVGLFTLDAILTPAGQAPLVGRDSIRANQEAFYRDASAASKHFYVVTDESPTAIEVDWAVAARMRNGELFTLQGHNVFELASDGRITRLTVTNA